MNYEETLEYMYSQLPMYQRIGKAAYKANLENTLALDELVGHPHLKFKTIHIAGTNGKGSTSHFLASILMQCGYKVGLYTSPHLIDYRERITVNGQKIAKEFVTDFVSQYKPDFESIKPSFFEMSVAMAFTYFAKEQVDYAVIETGLGGRLDSTNIITPILSVITNISLDHTQFLGQDIASIAREKGGIIKNNIPVVIGETQNESKSIFSEIANSQNAPLYFADSFCEIFNGEISYQKGFLKGTLKCNQNKKSFEIQSPLIGRYQFNNIKTVFCASLLLQEMGVIKNERYVVEGIAKVMENTALFGRWQIIKSQPLTICDIGHNKGGIETNMYQLMQIPHKRLHLVIGVANDKDVEGMMDLLPVQANYYYCKANIPRALDSSELALIGKRCDREGGSFLTVSEAIIAAQANAQPDDLIYIGGSAFVVADALVYFHENR